jgi:two-component system, LuxR family, sensor kinase FixL
MNANTPAKRRGLIAAVVGLTIAIFLVDMVTPLGIADGVPYVAPVLLSVWLRTQRWTLAMAIAATALTILGYFVSPRIDAVEWEVLPNEFLAIFAIWITAVLGLTWMRTSRFERQAKLLAKAVDNLGEGVLITDEHLDWPGPRIVFVNEAMCGITGYSAAEMIGQTPRVLQGSRTDRESMQWMKSELSAGRACSAEIINYRNGGAPYEAEVYITPLSDAEGRRTNYVSIHRDISERKRIEAQLRRISKVFTDSVHPILIKDLSGRIVDTNPAAERQYGWTRDELIGQSIRMLVPPEQHEQREELDARCLRREEVRSVEGWRVTKSGEVLPVLLTLSLLTDDDGKPVGIATISEDITERKRMEQALRDSEERMTLAVRATRDGIWDYDFSRGTVWWNDTYNELFGERPLQTSDSWQWWIDHVHPEDRQRAADGLRAAIESDAEYWAAEYRYLRANKDYADVLDRAYIVRDQAGKATRMLGAMTDITERKRAEQALREREDRLRAILNTAVDAIITIDQRGIIDSVNPATERMFGRTQDELIGQNVKILMPHPYRDEHDGYIERYKRTGEARVIGIGIGREASGKRKDGSTFPVDLAVSEIDHLGIFTGIVRDISQRRLLEKHVLEIAAEEQRRFGQELHDGTGQELTGLSLFADTLQEVLGNAPRTESEENATWLLEEADLVRLRQIAARLSRGLAETNRHIRDLSRGIVPVQIDAEGLRSALEELAAATDAQQGIACDFDCCGSVAVANNTTATQLYRIAQEALNNALRHGQADEMHISLLQSDGQIILEVSDNGIGFDPAAMHGAFPAEGGMGLRTMEYRAGMIGGHIRIGPNQAGGTTVRCSVIGRGAEMVSSPPTPAELLIVDDHSDVG